MHKKCACTAHVANLRIELLFCLIAKLARKQPFSRPQPVNLDIFYSDSCRGNWQIRVVFTGVNVSCDTTACPKPTK